MTFAKAKFLRAVELARRNPLSRTAPFRAIAACINELYPAAALILALLVLDEGFQSRALQALEDHTVLISLVLMSPLILKGLGLLIDFGIRLRDTFVPAPESLVSSATTIRSTMEFAAQRSSKTRVIGGVIEVACHPHNDRSIGDNGWATDNVRVGRAIDRFEIPEALKTGLSIEDDGEKFSLIGCSTPISDRSEFLDLNVASCNYSDIMGAQRNIRSKTQPGSTDAESETATQIRHRFSSADPSRHRIPNSLCLHCAVTFSDGNVLLMERNMTTDYFPGALSLSFEEQLHPSDFGRPELPVIESLFRRGLCEEIFPLTSLVKNHPEAAYTRIDQYIRSKRIWSVFLEELVGNFSMMGVCELNLTVGDYLEAYIQMQNEFFDQRDDEGRFFVMSFESMGELLSDGDAKMIELSFLDPSRRPERLVSEINPFPDSPLPQHRLHPSASYRAAMLWSCLKS